MQFQDVARTKMISCGCYKNGEKDGLWTMWDGNGNKYREGNYKDGLQVGV